MKSSIQGLYLVPEWRGTFSTLTVLENLELGAFPPRARDRKDPTLQHVFDIFPRLQERQSQRAGTLSGGERQMLAIGPRTDGLPGNAHSG